MFRTYPKAVLLSVCLLFASALFSQTKVSIDGKAYTVHQVRTGETFYSIAQAYKIQVDSLRAVNRLTDDAAALHPGDMLVVPLYAGKIENTALYTAPVTSPTPVPVQPTITVPVTNTAGQIEHVVKTGETLYSVARLYPHTNVASIKELNKLEVEGLSIGQILLIPTTKATAPVPTPPVAPKNVTPSTPRTAIDTNALYIPNKPSGSTVQNINANDATVSDEEDYGAVSVASFDMNMLADLKTKYNATAANGKVETIKGTATWLTDPSHENQYRFYAMHKTAPIGTVVKVRNLMNDRVIYAKVIGKIPNNRSNENIIVKLSGGAARYLNVLDDKFMVELSLPHAKL